MVGQLWKRLSYPQHIHIPHTQGNATLNIHTTYSHTIHIIRTTHHTALNCYPKTYQFRLQQKCILSLVFSCSMNVTKNSSPPHCSTPLPVEDEVIDVLSSSSSLPSQDGHSARWVKCTCNWNSMMNWLNKICECFFKLAIIAVTTAAIIAKQYKYYGLIP